MTIWIVVAALLILIDGFFRISGFYFYPWLFHKGKVHSRKFLRFRLPGANRRISTESFRQRTIRWLNTPWGEA